MLKYSVVADSEKDKINNVAHLHSKAIKNNCVVKM